MVKCSTEEKEYYFKIEGRILAKDDDDAREQVEKMANTTNTIYCENSVDEVDE